MCIKIYFLASVRDISTSFCVDRGNSSMGVNEGGKYKRFIYSDGNSIV
jgi:hypothetical protein